MEIEHRVTKLEFIADSHKQQITRLEDQSKNLSEKLSSIDKTLNQIKWLFMGGALVLAANEVGVINAFKLILG